MYIYDCLFDCIYVCMCENVDIFTNDKMMGQNYDILKLQMVGIENRISLAFEL